MGKKNKENLKEKYKTRALMQCRQSMKILLENSQRKGMRFTETEMVIIDKIIINKLFSPL
jgi:hypothetical protein